MRSITITVNVCLMMVLLTAGTSVLATEMDHSAMDHSKMNRSNMIDDTSLASTAEVQGKATLQKLAVMPASGKVREGGYDSRYAMESTDASNALAVQCAQASRGLVMMDNAKWSRCGGKPDGAVQASRSTGDDAKTMNEHAGHKM